jgi:DNA-binding NtrC family response regulator
MTEKKSVLIVDDDRAICSIFKEGLLASGYDCETAMSGKAAMAILRGRSFDVMVTDIIMPGMDGLELTSLAKQIAPDMAVIVMTGFQQDESYDQAIGIGASDFIKKPFAINELVIRLERVLRDSRVLSEIRRKQEEVRAISREMIAGMQDEAAKKIAQLETDIIALRSKIS